MHRPKFWNLAVSNVWCIIWMDWDGFRSEMMGLGSVSAFLAKPFSMADIFGKEQQSSQQLKQHTAIKGW